MPTPTDSTTRKHGYLPGRIGVTLVFWALTGYVLVSIFGSMLAELYGDAPKQLRHAESTTTLGHRARTWCVGRATGLKNELERHVRLELRQLSSAHPAKRRSADWESDWLAAHRDAATKCGTSSEQALRDTFLRLSALKTAYDNALGGLRDIRTVRAEKLEAGLRRLASP